VSKLVKFVENMCSVFDEGCCFVNQRFEIVVNELTDAFCRNTVARNNGASGVSLFVYFRQNVESSRFGVSLYEKFLSFVVNDTVFV